MLFALHDGSLYPYEGLQIRTPADLRADKNIINGVRLEPTSPHRISHYYVAKDMNKCGYGTTAAKDFQRIAQSQAIFAPSKYWRASMLRGVPELHSVVDALADADRVNANIQNMIKLQSSIWTIERKGAGIKGPGSSRFMDKGNGNQTQIDKAPHGMRVKTEGKPGEDFIMNKMDNPGSNHVPYQMYDARRIAAGVGLPLEMVLHLFTNGSYTANRAARVDFAKFITDRWAWRNKVLNQRVYNWVIAKAIKEGRIRKAPVGPNGLSEWHKCSWTLPYFPQIDEGKEIAADVRQWGAAALSLSDMAQEQGRTRGQLLDAHDVDIADMQARAKVLGITLAEYANEFFKSPAQQAEANRT
jgi:capsid protein